MMNIADRRGEKDYFPARLFTAAGEWLERNQDAENFFLVLDSFDPHEPWDPPISYRRLYDREEDAPDFYPSLYDRADMVTPRQLKRMRANYAGEVTLVDCWLGSFLEKMRHLGLMENTLIAVISDHGHCIGEHNLIGKQGHPMSREIADLVFMIHHPEGEAAGSICDSLIYNFDLPRTILARLGIEPVNPMDGKDIWPLALGKRKELYDHLTCAWGPFVLVRDKCWWYNAYLWGESALLYDLEKDPQLKNNIAREHPDICQRMQKLAVADAGGEVPEFLRKMKGEPGCTPLLA
jgi:arylsulfatase A-like enzyme